MQHKNIVSFLAFPKLYLPIKYYSIRVYNYQCACTNVHYSTIYSIKLTFIPTVSSLNFFWLMVFWTPISTLRGKEESLSFRARNLSISDLGINQFPSFKSLSYLVRNLTVSELGILQVWKILSSPMWCLWPHIWVLSHLIDHRQTEHRNKLTDYSCDDCKSKVQRWYCLIGHRRTKHKG